VLLGAFSGFPGFAMSPSMHHIENHIIQNSAVYGLHERERERVICGCIRVMYGLHKGYAKVLSGPGLIRRRALELSGLIF